MRRLPHTLRPLLEMRLADQGGTQGERDVVHQAMRKAFDIGEGELQALIEQAHEAQGGSVSYHEFSRQLRPGLDPDQRAELVE